MPDTLLTVAEVAGRLRLENPKTIYGYIATKKLLATRLGPKPDGKDHRPIRIKESELRKFLGED